MQTFFARIDPGSEVGLRSTSQRQQVLYAQLRAESMLFGHISPKSQGKRVIRKFGGTTPLLNALHMLGHKIDRRSINRWGFNGTIPADQMPYILEAALIEGIVLQPEDLDPRPRNYY